jgi:hypothetical protein
MFAAKPAQAATFNVNGTDYEITTVTGTYLGLQDQLVATPWWGNETLATRNCKPSRWSTRAMEFCYVFGQSNPGKRPTVCLPACCPSSEFKVLEHFSSVYTTV